MKRLGQQDIMPDILKAWFDHLGLCWWSDHAKEKTSAFSMTSNIKYKKKSKMPSVLSDFW